MMLRSVCVLFTEQRNLECKQLHTVTHKGSKKTQIIIVFKINYYTHTQPVTNKMVDSQFKN